MIRFCISVVFIIVFGAQFNAQVTKDDHYDVIDNKVYVFSKANPDALLDTITSFVNTHFQSAEDRARAYYTWLALNIEFDEDYRESIGFSLINDIRSPNVISQRIFNALQAKKSAGEGTANLMSEFCQASNIPCFTVSGYVRRPDGNISNMSFVWNVLYVDSVWMQVDASLVHGYLDLNHKFVRYPMPAFFGISPEDFLKDHFPYDRMWQLLKYPCERTEFEHRTYSFVNKAIYNFEDSLKSYQAKTMRERKKVDAIRYFNDQANLPLSNQDLEAYYMDKASFNMEEGIDSYNEYLQLGENKLSKYPLKTDWINAKKYLDKAETKFKEVEIILAKMPHASSEIYNYLHTGLLNNMANVKRNQVYLGKLKPFLKDR
ncbi:MAG: transglutaminase domain-containing protein [Bacteroidota bacterium]